MKTPGRIRRARGILTRLLLLCPLLGTVTCTRSCIPPAACPSIVATGDPADTYLYAYTEQRYDAGPWVPHPSSGNIAGSVYFPVRSSVTVQGPVYIAEPNPVIAGQGRLPLVLLVHGFTDAPPASYLGYTDLQESLAANGMIAVAPRMDVLDHQVLGDDDWANRLLATIQYLYAQSLAPGSVYFQRIDFGRIGLMGHSRGGAAITRLAAQLSGVFKVRAVLMLATDSNPPWISDVPVLSILPAAEGIGSGGYDPFTAYPGAPGYPDLPAARRYDEMRPTPFKVQLCVHKANHSYWNRVWTTPEGAPTPNDVLQYRHLVLILRSYGTAFFGTFLRDWVPDATDESKRDYLRRDDGPMAYLNGHKKPWLHRNADPYGGSYPETSVDPSLLQLSWLSQYTLVVDNHEGAEGISQNSLGGPITSSGLTLQEDNPLTGYAGHTRMLIADQQACNDPVVTPCTGFVRSELPATYRNLQARRAINVRAAEIYNSGPLPDRPLAFELGLETASGQVVWVSSADVGGVPRPYLRQDRAQRFLLTTLRFNLDCFGDPVHSNLQEITAILLRPQNPTGRAIAFDDLSVE